VTFEWDEHNTGCFERHGVGPSEVEQVISMVEIRTEIVSGETRRHALGESNTGRILYIIWTLKPGRTIRFVTAWPANGETCAGYRQWKEAQK
jgi:uncharacterized DUF497 family protein